MRTLPVVVLLAAAAAAGVLVAASYSKEPAQARAQPAAAAAQPSAVDSVTVVVSQPADDEDQAGEADDDEEAIPLDRVPAKVLEAAKQALEGFVPDSAEIDSESGSPVYDVHGLLNGKTWEVEVSPDGKVLGTELDED